MILDTYSFDCFKFSNSSITYPKNDIIRNDKFDKQCVFMHTMIG